MIIITPDLRFYVSDLTICKRSEGLKHSLQSHLNETSQHQVAIQLVIMFQKSNICLKLQSTRKVCFNFILLK